MKKTIKFLISCILIAFVLTSPIGIYAESFVSGSLSSYSYDYWGEGVISPDVYKTESIINGRTLKISNFNKPEDLFIADDGLIYVLDTGNNRVVVLNQDGTFKTEISKFSKNGESTFLNAPMGIYVNSEQHIIIADTQNRRVIKSDINGNILLEINEPGEDFNFTGVDYLPQKVLEDSNDCIYVLCEGVYQGAMMYENTGEFIGYFGANKVEVTFKMIANSLWRRLMTKEQREKTTQYVPVQFDNMFIDEDGFIYTVTKVSSTNKNQLKKLNPKGIDVLPVTTSISQNFAEKYGDIKSSSLSSGYNKTKLCDVTVDSNGFISVLDFFRGRIFQYDSQGNLLVAFGGLGEQEGFFALPSAIESYGDKLYVLDKNKGNITVMSLTEYGTILHNATIKYNSGLYSESEKFWEEVLSRNNNLTLAYIGLGKIHYERADYKKAMEYFKLGEDRTNYGNAYKLERNNIMRKYVFPIAGIVIILAVAIWFIVKIYKVIKKQRQLALAMKQSRERMNI